MLYILMLWGSPENSGADSLGLRFFIFNKLPGDANAAGPGDHTLTSKDLKYSWKPS